MEATPICYSLLDQFALEFLDIHGLSNKPTHPLLQQVRQYIIVERSPSKLLEDEQFSTILHQNIVQQIMILQVLEYISNHETNKALEYFKTQPQLQNHTNILLLLLFDPSKIKALEPYSNIVQIRERVVGLVQQSLMYSNHFEESKLSLLFKYLIGYHNYYHINYGVESVFPELFDQFIHVWRQTPNSNSTTALQNTIRVKESDLNFLMQILGITKDEATQTMKSTNCAVGKAIELELKRIIVRSDTIIPLVLEYCVDRGLSSHTNFTGWNMHYTTHGEDKNNNSAVLLKTWRELMTKEEYWKLLESIRTVPQTSHQLEYKLKQMYYICCILENQLTKANHILYNDIINNRDISMEWREMMIWPFLTIDKVKQKKLELQTTLQLEMEKLYSMIRDKSKEPKLVRLVKYLLYSHSQYYAKQLSVDVYSKQFYIDALKKEETSQSSIQQVQQQITEEDEDEDDEEEDESTRLPLEQAIALLMEIVPRLQREEAETQLRRHNNSVEAALQAIFG